MKTIIGYLLAFCLLLTACRKPPFQDRPAEPEIAVDAAQMPVMPLPWHVLKGVRIAGINPVHIPQIFLQSRIL